MKQRSAQRRGDSVRRRAAAVLCAGLLAGCGTTVPLAQQAQPQQGGGLDTGGAATSTGSTPTVPGATQPGTTGSLGAGQTPGSGTSPSAGASRAPGTSGPGGGGSRAAAVPAKGFGWDAHHVYLGIPYQDTSSTNAAAKGLGLNGLVGVDYRAASRAVLADINKHGGLFGRTVEPVFANFPPLPNQTGQAQCATWTQDHQVFAVVDTFYTADALYGCLAKAKVPYGNGIIAPMADPVLKKYAPYAHKLHVTSTTRLEPTLLARLRARGFFQKWDSLRGAPGTAPVKAGLFCRSDDESQRAECAEMSSLLKKQGYDLASTYSVSGTSDQSSGAVLKFKAAGVTHVFCATTDLLFFMLNASNQSYYPRYAVTSLNAPFLLTSNAPPKELHGALGVGFSPYNDVSSPPPPTAAQAHCLAVMKQGGVDVPAAPSAQMLAQNICDQISVWVDAARQGGGLDPPHVIAGLDGLKGVYTPGSIFASGLSSTRYDEAAAVRDLGWSDGCACFAYLSATNWPT
jgi:hypothetical protein